jgi:hypothetical protein
VIRSRRIGGVGHVAHIRDRRITYMVLMGKPEGERPLGRPRHGWEDNIEMSIQEVGWGPWTGLVWLGIGMGGGMW